MSNAKKPGCLGYIGDDTTQLCGIFFINHSKDPYETTSISWKARPFCFFVAHIKTNGESACIHTKIIN